MFQESPRATFANRHQLSTQDRFRHFPKCFILFSRWVIVRKMAKLKKKLGKKCEKYGFYLFFIKLAISTAVTVHKRKEWSRSHKGGKSSGCWCVIWSVLAGSRPLGGGNEVIFAGHRVPVMRQRSTGDKEHFPTFPNTVGEAANDTFGVVETSTLRAPADRNVITLSRSKAPF